MPSRGKCHCGHDDYDHVCEAPSDSISDYRPCYECKCRAFVTCDNPDDMVRDDND